MTSLQDSTCRISRSRPTKLYQYIQDCDWINASKRISVKPKECSIWIQQSDTCDKGDTVNYEWQQQRKKMEMKKELEVLATADDKKGSSGTAVLNNRKKTLSLLVPKQLRKRSTLLAKEQSLRTTTTSSTNMTKGIQTSTRHLTSNDFKAQNEILPIHLACQLKAPLYILQKLLLADHTSSSALGPHGEFPLHLACQHHASLFTIQCLLEHCPSALVTHDEFGLLPLHLACSAGGNINVIKALCLAFPNSAKGKMVDQRGRTPLDLVEEGLNHHPNHKNILEVLKSFKEEVVKERDTSKVNSDVDDNTNDLKELKVDVTADCREKDDNESDAGWSLVSNGNGSICRTSSALISLIRCKKWTEALDRLNQINHEQEGFQIVCHHDICNEAAVWTSIGSAISNQNQHRQLALHEACASKPPYYVISALVRSYPYATHCIETQHGMTPLHIACQNGANPAVVQELINSNPSAAKVRDVFGLLPLHLACTEGARLEVVKLVCDYYTAAVTCQDSSGYTPIEYVRMSLDPGSEAIEFYLQCVLDGNPELAQMPVQMPKTISREESIEIVLSSNTDTDESSRQEHRVFVTSMEEEENEEQVLKEEKPQNIEKDDLKMTHRHSDPSTGTLTSNSSDDHYIIPSEDAYEKLLQPIGPSSNNSSRAKQELQDEVENEGDIQPNRSILSILNDHGNTTSQPLPDQNHQHIVRNSSNRDVAVATPSTCRLYQLLRSRDWVAVLQSLHNHQTNNSNEQEEISVWVRDDEFNRIYLPLHKACTLLHVPSLVRNTNHNASFSPPSSRRNIYKNHSSTNLSYPLPPTGENSVKSLSPPLVIISKLIEACPEAVKATDVIEEMLPLHLACKYGVHRPDVIRQLLKAHPDAINTINARGELPLHLACIAGRDYCNATHKKVSAVTAAARLVSPCLTFSTMETLEILISAHPYSVHEETHAGHSPVDLLEKSSIHLTKTRSNNSVRSRSGNKRNKFEKKNSAAMLNRRGSNGSNCPSNVSTSIRSSVATSTKSPFVEEMKIFLKSKQEELWKKQHSSQQSQLVTSG